METEDILLEANRLSEEGLDAEALSLLLEAEPENQENAALLCMIGALSAHLSADGMAVDFFRRTLELEPTDPRILITAGSGLAAVGAPGGEPALRLAAVTHPEMPEARLAYGAFMIRNGVVSEGIEELKAARDLAPDEAEPSLQLGIGYWLNGQMDDALSELETAVAADSEHLDARVIYSLALLGAERIEDAAEELYPLGEPLAADGPLQLIMALTFGATEWDNEAWLALSRAEGADPPVDAMTAREVEEALEAGEDAIRDLLLEELAPPALRERIFLT